MYTRIEVDRVVLITEHAYTQSHIVQHPIGVLVELGYKRCFPWNAEVGWVNCRWYPEIAL